MRTLKALFIAIFAVGVLVIPQAAWATAWGAWFYDITTARHGHYLDECSRAGIVDTASNQVYLQTRPDPEGCSGATANVPAGYFAGYLGGYRNGSFCGNSSTAYSTISTWGAIFKINMCANPSGGQTFYTVGHAGMYDDGSMGASPGYIWSNHTSPKQNY